MPPTRRRPTPQPRRPKVAGLRNRTVADARPVASEQPEPASPASPTAILTSANRADNAAETDVTGAARRPDEVSEANAVNGVIGAVETQEDHEAPATTEAAGAAAPEQVTDPEDAPEAEGATDAAPANPPPSTEPAAPAAQDDADGSSREQVRRGGGRGRSRRLALPAVIAALLVCSGLAVWFRVEQTGLASSNAATNQALVDTGRTTEVSGQVTEALEKVLSFSYDRTDEAEQNARTYLTGPAIDEYNQLFAQVKQNAATQKLVLSARVVTTGVKALEGDRAVVLVFLDQVATRADKNQSSASGSMFSVSAERTDGRWRISGFDMLGQQNNAQQQNNGQQQDGSTVQPGNAGQPSGPASSTSGPGSVPSTGNR